MPNDKNLPATVRKNSTLPQAQPSGLVARGLAAIQQSLSVPEKQDAESLFKKGMRYRNDESRDPQNSDRARAYLLEAANLNHAEAQFELCLLLGEYYEWPEAVAWLEKSVSLSFGPAQKYLALALFDPLIADHLSNPNYDQSQLYRQASAWYNERAKAGDPAAQYDFALMHWGGEATNYSPEEAMRWMKAAAEQNHGFACWRLGNWLLDDKAPHHNTERGIYWLSRAAELGKSTACKDLGDLYLLGHMGGLYALKKGEKYSQLIPPDKNAAVSWYERQIKLDRARGSFMSTDSLARLYLSGDHLDQDLARAERSLLETANAGYLDSQRLLAFEYTSGKRLRKDTTAALHWLKMAEENSSSSKLRDQYQLGYFYEHDSDDAPNYVEAVKWYLKAAEQGDYRSQKSLGVFYEAGKGVPKDYVQAYKWHLLSVAHSYGKPGIKEFHTDATKTLNALAQKMTPSQIAEARQLASDLFDTITSLHPADYELAKEGLAKGAS
jgi:TPR repeat protein